MYKYTITTKAIFPCELTFVVSNKEEIEQATGMTITDDVWSFVEEGEKGVEEDTDHVLHIEKIKK